MSWLAGPKLPRNLRWSGDGGRGLGGGGGSTGPTSWYGVGVGGGGGGGGGGGSGAKRKGSRPMAKASSPPGCRERTARLTTSCTDVTAADVALLPVTSVAAALGVRLLARTASATASTRPSPIARLRSRACSFFMPAAAPRVACRRG